MFKVLLELLLLYVLYKVIFDFIIPIYQTTKQVKQKVSKMQQDINDQMQRQNKQAGAEQPKAKPASTAKDDYIDYEEIK